MNDKPNGVTMEKVIAKYIKLRDKEAEIDRIVADAKRSIAEQKALLERYIQAKLQQEGEKNATTASGTAYRKTVSTARVADKKEWLAWAFNTSNMDMLPSSCKSTEVCNYIKEMDEVPPGIDYRQVEKIGVNAPRKKA